MLKTEHVLVWLALCLSFLLLPGSADSLDCIESHTLFDILPGADQPSDIAIAPDGRIYLVDGVQNRIIVVDRQGRPKFSFGSMGTRQGEFKYPLGIDISDDGKVFIADSGNHRIQIFDSSGQFLHMFDVGAKADEKPADPVDVLASRLKGLVYVSDNDNHKIKVYDQRGQFQFEWGKFGEEAGEFRYPGILASNEFNQIFVVDVLNTRVQLFEPYGRFITDIGGWGVLPGKLFRPKGVTVDKNNRVFISDSYIGLVQVFSDLGQFLGVLCEKNQKRRFVTPVGLVMDSHNRLKVVEMRRNKISVLQVNK